MYRSHLPRANLWPTFRKRAVVSSWSLDQWRIFQWTTDQIFEKVSWSHLKGSLGQWRIIHWTTDQLFEIVSWSHLERSNLHLTTDQLFGPCRGLELLRQQASSATVGDGTTITTSSSHHRLDTSAEYSAIYDQRRILRILKNTSACLRPVSPHYVRVSKFETSVCTC
jgi:hypothetical protein